MSTLTELLKLAAEIDLVAASDAWKRAKTPCYVKSQDGKYLAADGSWGPKENRKIYPTPQEGIYGAASARGNNYGGFVYRDSDGRPVDPRDKDILPRDR